ncbi:unnamed protein product [Mortierella alpina]
MLRLRAPAKSCAPPCFLDLSTIVGFASSLRHCTKISREAASSKTSAATDFHLEGQQHKNKKWREHAARAAEDTTGLRNPGACFVQIPEAPLVKSGIHNHHYGHAQRADHAAVRLASNKHFESRNTWRSWASDYAWKKRTRASSPVDPEDNVDSDTRTDQYLRAIDGCNNITGDASDTNMDVDQREDDLQDEEPFVESDILGEPSSSVNMDPGSTNMVINEDNVPTDQELLQRLHEERRGLLEAKHVAVRRLAAGRANREKAEAAILAVADKDRSIALMSKL